MPSRHTDCTSPAPTTSLSRNSPTLHCTLIPNTFCATYNMGFDDCPLCHRGYLQLSQHLTVTHGVKNKEERKLLLAILSGRVDVRKGTCPVSACSETTTRMDRHLRGHSELSAAARRRLISSLKMAKILNSLAELRASNPAVAMMSCIDQQESFDVLEEAVAEEGAAAPPSGNPCCQKDLAEKEDLMKQVDTLSKALREMTRRYRLLKRRKQAAPSAQVTSPLLYTLRSPGKGVAEEEKNDQPLVLPLEKLAGQDQPPSSPRLRTVVPAAPSSPKREEHPFPDHVPALKTTPKVYSSAVDCPICPMSIVNISKHLRCVHKMINSAQRAIMINHARRRVKLADLNCPLCGKFVRYPERHLENGHRDLSAASRLRAVKSLERLVTTEKLRLLWTSEQAVPSWSSTFCSPSPSQHPTTQ